MRIKSIVILILCIMPLSGCLGTGFVVSKLLGGGKSSGPTVNADVQVGKNNTKALVSNSESTDTKAGDNAVITNTKNENQVQAEGSVDSINVMNQDIHLWMILLLVLGWILPSPIEIWRGFLKTITLGRYRG
jgi:hypothetical protein